MKNSVQPDPSHAKTGVSVLPSGLVLDPYDIDPMNVRALDVASALSNICRFAGNVRRFYSVAEHCVLVATILRARNAPPRVQLAGLLHDAFEYVTGDITSPTKRGLLVYDAELDQHVTFAEVEADGLERIMDGLAPGLTKVLSEDDWALIHTSDEDAFEIECEAVRTIRPDFSRFGAYSPYLLGLRALGMSPELAKREWLSRLSSLLLETHAERQPEPEPAPAPAKKSKGGAK